MTYSDAASGAPSKDAIAEPVDWRRRSEPPDAQ
jgi:hypothetical protein